MELSCVTHYCLLLFFHFIRFSALKCCNNIVQLMDVSVCISPVLHQNVHHPLVMGEWMGSLREVSEITHNVLHIEFPFLPTKNSTNYLPAVCACIFICTMRSDSKMFLALCLLSCQPPTPTPHPTLPPPHPTPHPAYRLSCCFHFCATSSHLVKSSQGRRGHQIQEGEKKEEEERRWRG